MTEVNGDSPEVSKQAKLPWRDWMVLPLLALLTVGLLAKSTEFVARRMFSESKNGVERCWVVNDPSTGVRGVPNSTCWEKIAEAQLIEYKFNACGHRAGVECGLKPPDAYRIVMTGSSFAMGMRVPREQTLAALLPKELSRLSGRKVEIYNEGMGDAFTHSVALRFNEVLAARPDMILWVLTPMDIQQASFVVPHHDASAGHGEIKRRLKDALAARSVLDKVRGLSNLAGDVWANELEEVHDDVRVSRAGFLLQHFLYESQSLYVESYLRSEDDKSGFLKADLSARWRNNLRLTEVDAADIESRAEAAGVPFVVVPLPNRAQAAMISMGQWPSGYDPYKLDDELRAIIERHGGTYIDVLQDFRSVPNPEKHYLPIDGHPDADGHAIITGLLAKELTGGAVPALASANRQQAQLEHRR